MSEHIHIRWMIRRDMPDVLAIEQASFAVPWSEDDFVRAMRQRNCIGMVAERDERIVGYMLYFLHKSRLDLVNLAVHQDHRRTVVGRAMLEKLKHKTQTGRRERITTSVADHNLRSHLFLRACGWRATGVERGAWGSRPDDPLGGETDAYRFEWRVAQEATV